MIITDFDAGSDMWKFLAKFWPRDKPHTANDPIWIIAGTKEEFDDFVIQKRSLGLHFDYRFVQNVSDLRGLQRIRGFYIGTYKERIDWPALERAIESIKENGG